MAAPPILILVEGPSDVEIVVSLIHRAGLPVERFRVLAVGGRGDLLGRQLEASLPQVVLVDQDDRSLPDAEASARARLGATFAGAVFCAVPEIEAWLLADEQLLLRRLSDDAEAMALLRRLPLPEEIPRPRELLKDLFGANSRRPQFLRPYIAEMDLARACARSPSLRRFLEGLATMVDARLSLSDEVYSRSLHRDVLSGLLGEVSADTVMWRSVSGDTYTASELREQIEQGTDLGRQYAADLLRVARDLLKRSARPRTA